MKSKFPVVVFSLICGWIPHLANSAQFPTDSTPIAITVERPPLILARGEQRLLNLPGLERYSLGGQVVRVLPLPKVFGPHSTHSKNSILLKGYVEGTGDLWIWKKDSPPEHRIVRVEKTPPGFMSGPLEKALGKLNETEIIFTGKGTVLRGKIHTLKEGSYLAALVHQFPGEIQDETELSPLLLEKGKSEIENWLKTSGYSSKLRLEMAGDRLWVRGNLDRPTELPQVQRQLKSRFPFILTEIEVLPDHAPTIYFRVFLLELRRSQFHNLGLSWPAGVPGAFQVTSAGIQSLLQIDLTLQALAGQGNAKILSNPELVVRAPGEAELFAGGEIPIRTLNRYSSNVAWKSYGLTLKLKVTHTTGDRARLDIFTEVSHLDTHIALDQIPGIQSNRMKTQVDARFGVPLLLSGLLQEDIREEVKGLPILRQIPVLGLLFGSDDFLNERSELVAILYPHSAPPTAPIERFSQLHPRILPKGPVPPPRDWIAPSIERTLRDSKDYPWNILD